MMSKYYIQSVSKRLGILLLLLSFSMISFGQSLHIHGKVMDVTNKEPIGYATVAAIGSTAAASTDDGGNFVLQVSPNFSKIRVSFVGYESQDISISNETHQELTIYLVPEENSIEAVEVQAPRRARYSNKNNPAVELIRK